MRHSKSYRRGFSLIELTIYSSLLLFLMGSVYFVLVTGLHYFRLGDVFKETQGQAILAMRKMRNEIANTTPAAISLVEATPEDNMVFLSPDELYPNQTDFWTYNGFQELEWKKWVCFYHDSTNQELIRAELTEPTAPASIPQQLTPLPLGGFTIATGEGRRVLAREVSQLEFVREIDRVHITVTISSSTGSGPNEVTEVTLPSLVRMKNSGF
jgi:hypothetical protein